MFSKPIRIPNSQRGVGMIEVMIAVFLFAVTVAGLMALQVTSAGTLSNSNSLSMASMSASSLADRMRANPQGVSGGSYDGIDGKETKPDCSDDCSAAEIAQLDAYEIMNGLNGELPDVSLNVASAANDMYTIKIQWTERIKNSTETKTHTFTFLPYNP